MRARIFAAMVVLFSVIPAIPAAEPAPAAFSLNAWATAESEYLLKDAAYVELLNRCIGDLDAIEAWRNRQLDVPAMAEANRKLVGLSAELRALEAENPASRSAISAKSYEVDTARREIDGLWNDAESSAEYTRLTDTLNSDTAKLFERAKRVLTLADSGTARRALRMMDATNAVAIPQAARQITAEAAPRTGTMALSDYELYAKYERESLMKDPGYSFLKARSDEAFGILAKWQELQLSATPEGRKMLENFEAAAAKVKQLAGKDANSTELIAARNELAGAAEELRRTQYYCFRNDRQNKVLTDSYYQANLKKYERGMELLSAMKNDPKAQALCGRIRLLNGAPLSGKIEVAAAPAAPVAPLADWEKRWFENDDAYIGLRNSYIRAREELRKYQHEALSADGEGAVLLSEIAESEATLRKLSASKASQKLIDEVTKARNDAVRELGKIYFEQVADRAANKNLQLKVTEARAALRKYAVARLSATDDPEAKAAVAQFVGDDAAVRPESKPKATPAAGGAAK
ncbi:MAG: hypothetical protein VB042_08970 [Victivallaceae bacterium]|nr:hypothetical protein [Victivallaceae bacterium]